MIYPIQPAPIRIAIADDHAAVRQSIALWLHSEGNMQVCLEACNDYDLLRQLETTSVDLVLLDIRMPVMNGWQVLEELREQYPFIRIILMSGFSEEETIAAGYENSGITYFSKSDDLIRLSEKIYESLRFRTKNTDTSDYTNRELDIIRELQQNKTSREIAGKLGLSVRTVQNYRQNILLKAGARNTLHLLELLSAGKIRRSL